MNKKRRLALIALALTMAFTMGACTVRIEPGDIMDPEDYLDGYLDDYGKYNPPDPYGQTDAPDNVIPITEPGKPEETNEAVREYYQYTGIIDANSIEVRFMESGEAVVLRLSEELRANIQNIDEGSIIIVEYYEDGNENAVITVIEDTGLNLT